MTTPPLYLKSPWANAAGKGPLAISAPTPPTFFSGPTPPTFRWEFGMFSSYLWVGNIDKDPALSECKYNWGPTANFDVSGTDRPAGAWGSHPGRSRSKFWAVAPCSP